MDTDKKDKIKKETSIMKMFIDTANVDHIREANDLGVICGVTTNPSLIAKEGRDFGGKGNHNHRRRPHQRRGHQP